MSVINILDLVFRAKTDDLDKGFASVSNKVKQFGHDSEQAGEVSYRSYRAAGHGIEMVGSAFGSANKELGEHISKLGESVSYIGMAEHAYHGLHAVIDGLIAKQTLLNVLSGPMGWAALAVAGVAVASGAYLTLGSQIDNVTESEREYQKALDETNKKIRQDREADPTSHRQYMGDTKAEDARLAEELLTKEREKEQTAKDTAATYKTQREEAARTANSIADLYKAAPTNDTYQMWLNAKAAFDEAVEQQRQADAKAKQAEGKVSEARRNLAVANIEAQVEAYQKEAETVRMDRLEKEKYLLTSSKGFQQLLQSDPSKALGLLANLNQAQSEIKTGEAAKGVEELTQGMQRAAATMGMSRREAELWTATHDKFGNAIQVDAELLRQWADADRELTQDEIARWGGVAEAVEQYKRIINASNGDQGLMTKGMSELADSLFGMGDAYEQAQRKIEKWQEMMETMPGIAQRAAKAIAQAQQEMIDSVLGFTEYPEEKYEKLLARLQDLQQQGKITKEEANEAATQGRNRAFGFKPSQEEEAAHWRFENRFAVDQWQQGKMGNAQFQQTIMSNAPPELKNMLEQLQTPMEKLKDAAAKWEETVATYHLGASVERRGLQHLAAQSGLGDHKYAGAMTYGSQEAYKAWTESKGKAMGQDDIMRQLQSRQAGDVNRIAVMLQRLVQQRPEPNQHDIGANPN